MSSVAGGFPDWQRITQWFGTALDQQTAYAIGAGAHPVGPLDVRNFASIVVCVRPVGGNVTVTVAQQVPGGPVGLVVSESFTVNAGNVVFESFVLLAGAATVTFQGTAGGETLDYAIVPSNVNTNAEVALVTTLGFQHNDAPVASEQAVDLEDGAGHLWTLTDDPANQRMKVALGLAPGAVAGGAYAGALGNNGASFPTVGLYNGYRFALQDYINSSIYCIRDFVYRADIDATHPWYFCGGPAYHSQNFFNTAASGVVVAAASSLLAGAHLRAGWYMLDISIDPPVAATELLPNNYIQAGWSQVGAGSVSWLALEDTGSSAENSSVNVFVRSSYSARGQTDGILTAADITTYIFNQLNTPQTIQRWVNLYLTPIKVAGP